MNMNETVTNVTMTKVCTLKPFKGATDSKQVTLAIKYDGLTLSDVFAKALRQDVISWQNGPGRKGYATLVNKSTVQVNASKPGAITVDPETAMVAKLMSMTSEEQTVYLAELYAKASGHTVTETPPKPTVTVKKVEPEVVSEETIRVVSS